MNLDVKNIQIQNSKKCKCGHEFTLKDFTSLESVTEKGFYGNIVKDFSHTKCPKCETETLLLLRQKGQTWEILDTATFKDTQTDKIQTQESNDIKNNTTPQEFICPICKKVCKSQIGLNSHVKTHQN